MTFPPRVRVVEVGPRDGLQNEANSVSTLSKVRLIHSLAHAGLRTIECGSFVSPTWVPQMADTPEVYAQLRREPFVTYVALVPNPRGLEAALQARVSEIAVFAAASETFSQRNTNASIAQSLDRIQQVASAALAAGVAVRAYVSCAIACPYEGPIAPRAVTTISERLLELGCYEISLADTIGAGTPGEVGRLLDSVLPRISASKLAVHFHDTRGQALANVLAAMDRGVAVVDTSVAGLGGCPFAPGAAGNLATEDLIYMLNGIGIQTGVSLPEVIQAGRSICRELGREPVSKVSRAGNITNAGEGSACSSEHQQGPKQCR